MNTTFKLIPYNSSDWKKAVELREKVLRHSIGSSFTAAELEIEKAHLHIAGFLNYQLVATAVLVPEGNNMKMQRVAVEEDLRNYNIGSDMMLFCEELAQQKGVKQLYCHARNTAVNFYLKNGYAGEGDYFDEDGIPHLKMTKQLS